MYEKLIEINKFKEQTVQSKTHIQRKKINKSNNPPLFSVEFFGLLFLKLRPLLSIIILSGRTNIPRLAPQEK